MLPHPDGPPTHHRAARLAAGGLALVLAIAVAGAAGLRLLPAAPRPPGPVASPPALPPPPPERFEEEIVRLARNETVSQALARAGLDAGEVTAVVQALQGSFPFRKARPGDQLRVERRAGDRALHRVVARQGYLDEWLVEPAPGGGLAAARRTVDVRSEVDRVAVSIRSSLYESIQSGREDPGLAVLAADVLAWDVDFYQDVRTDDRIRIVVEKTFADDRFVRYGEILAVDYDGSATGRKRLFRYTDPEGRTSYFDEDGQSAQRGFLRSPLKYAHVTSRFGTRRHPLKGYVHSHTAIDYGAPTGTPVWAVGDGTVRTAGWMGACGKAVLLRHRNGLETLYCHLSGIAVSAGARVGQKQVVGWVGSTGVSTGPHLHYAVRRNGGYINPAALKLPREAPVKPEWMEHFRAAIAPLQARLDAEPLAMN